MSRPFDKARYQALLEGLEVTVQPLSEVLLDNRVFRFDAQYFSKTALQIEATLKESAWCKLKDAADQVESFGAYALTNEFSYVEEGVPFLRCLNIRQGFTDFSDVLYITESANSLLSKSEIQPGMVLLTMSGSVGNASVALPSWKYPINSNQDIAKITPKKGVDGFYLTAFIGSKYGRAQMERLPVGSVQQHIFLWMIERLVIRRLLPETEAAIGKAISGAYSLEQSAITNIHKAEQTLLHTLGLENWQPPEPLTYTRSSKEIFASDRIDAEHYQEVYYDLRHRLSESTETLLTIGELSESLTNGAEIREYQEYGTPYLRVADIRYLTVNKDSVVNVDSVLASRELTKVQLNTGDVLVSRSGSLAVTAVVELEWEHALISSHLIRLRIQDHRIDPYYLALFLSSTPGRMQIEQWSNGGVQPEISQPSLRKIVVPCIAPSVQSEIRTDIASAKRHRDLAAHFLDAAKRAVEIAIETDEATALEFLNTTNEKNFPPP